MYFSIEVKQPEEWFDRHAVYNREPYNWNPFQPLVPLSDILGKNYHLYYCHYGHGFYHFYRACRRLKIFSIEALRNAKESDFCEIDEIETRDMQKKIYSEILKIRADILNHYRF